MQFDIQNIVLLSPEIILAVAAMAILMLGVFTKNLSKFAAHMTVLVFIAIALVLAFLAGDTKTGSSFFGLSLEGLSFGGGTYNNMFIADDFAQFVKIVLAVSAALVVIQTYSYEQKVRKFFGFEYYVLICFSVVGMFIMVSSTNLLIAYLGIELQSLSLYVLAASDRNRLKPTEAGLKYFVLGALASSLLLFGASYIYGLTGSLNFVEISTMLMELKSNDQVSISIIIGLILFIVGLFFKISAAPFHMWTPDVYHGVPAPVTTFFAIVPKIAGVALLVRFLNDAFPSFAQEWQQIVYFASIASMLVGSIGALGQKNIKRLLAYSSIGHIGFILIGVVVSSEESISAVLNYMAIYAFMSLLAFGVILVISNRYIDRAESLQQLDDFYGLSSRSPMLAACLAVAMFSMAGIPPLAGFFAKFYLFSAAVNSEYYILAITGLVLSVISAYYYIKIIKCMYFEEPKKNKTKKIQFNLTTANKLVLGLAFIFNVFYFLVPNTINAFAVNAASSLF